MSNPRIPIPLRTNIRKVQNHNLDVDAGVLRYQSVITGEPAVIGQGDVDLTPTEEKAVHQALFRRHFLTEHVVSKFSDDDVLLKNTEDCSDQPGLVSYMVVDYLRRPRSTTSKYTRLGLRHHLRTPHEQRQHGRVRRLRAMG
jgi:hypothetical protein